MEFTLQNKSWKNDKMMRRIIFATGNQEKMKEIRQIMAGCPVEVLSMKEAGIQCDVEENGKTFAENARIKANAIAAVVKAMYAKEGKEYTDIVLADDSGLEIDALNKEPGVYSARYMGEDTPYHEKNMNLIARLEGVPVEKRSARFVCAIAAFLPDGEVIDTQATIEGYIGYEEKGEFGFGYDPIFCVLEFGCTTSELTMEQKNKISHRGKALTHMREELMKRGLFG